MLTDSGRSSLNFIGKIPTGILIDRSESIKLDTIREMIANDLSAVVNIIGNNQ